MKSTVLFAALLFAVNLVAEPRPRVEPLSFEKAFVPIGFDTNDKAQVVIVGRLPSTCYKVGNYDVKVDLEARKVFVGQNAYVSAGPCIQMTIPFMSVIDVGILPEGEYQVLDNTSVTTMASLPVAKAPAEQTDDYFYAPVSEAFVGEKGKTITVKGTFPDRCTKYKKSIVRYYKDVIVVQPVAIRLTDGLCKDEMNDFSVAIPVTENLRGTYLLHVRTLNGQAINRLETIGN